jgi:hypothetical protein
MPSCGFEMYLQYRVLPVAQFSEVLRTTEGLYRVVYGLLADVPLIPARNRFLSDPPVPPRVSLSAVNRRLREYPQDRLGVASIATGQSIKVRLKTGWFDVDLAQGELVVTIPKGAAAVLAAGTRLVGQLLHQ